MINYYLLAKPGIIMGNLVTVAAGFLLASKGEVDIFLFLATLLGLAFIMGSGCVFNNYIDRPLDKKMERTKERPLVKGVISGKSALAYGTLLGVVGSIILLTYTNLLTFIVAAMGFFVYVVLYSLWKGKTIYSTAIGSVAGAVPPVVGYCAVSNQVDAGVFILFAMLVLWQMPHFFSIALYHFDDYSAANIPVLPLMKGVYRTKVHMALYIAAFLFTAVLLTYFDYMGYLYLAVIMLFGLAWLALSLRGFQADNDREWGKQMFRLSLVMIIATSLVIPFDVVTIH